MSTQETEETEEGTEEITLSPAADLDDLFADESEEDDFEPVIPDNLTDDELRARLVAAEKKAKFERDQRLATARKSWITEAKEHFPYSSPEEIKADSRRSFLEEASKQDKKFREKAAPILEKSGKTEEQLREEIRAELEGEAARAFGRPTVGSGTGSKETAEEETDKRLDTARRKRDLVGATKALMDGRRI